MNYSNSLKRATGACCLCACLCLSGSAAYMTYSTTVQNVITMGSIQIELDVQDGVGQDLGEDARTSAAPVSSIASALLTTPTTPIGVSTEAATVVPDAPVLSTAPASSTTPATPDAPTTLTMSTTLAAPTNPSKEATVLPGTSVPYKVRVQNTGTDDAFVRIKLDCRATPVQFQDFIGLDINYRSWAYQNGFLVYRDLIKPGQLTEPLFTTINFSPEYSGLSDADAKLRASSNPSCTVSVTAYAVQAANNAPSPLLAFGWPKE